MRVSSEAQDRAKISKKTHKNWRQILLPQQSVHRSFTKCCSERARRVSCTTAFKQGGMSLQCSINLTNHGFEEVLKSGGLRTNSDMASKQR
ncbi:hypothetical protein BaRGS_00017638 [Batillaria attramentaria]|uniref:Ribosomal protein S14 n=1 Tax=Batillaria attramentaria TaxID=370345 RepID=A0ABD0KVA0_9CAEN